MPNHSLPRLIPANRVAGLLDTLPTARHKFVLALIAVRALRPKQISTLLLADLDRSTGRLQVRSSGDGRSDAVRVVHLDEHTLLLAKNMLAERHERWPMSSNPHLVLSAVSAMHPDASPVDYTMDWVADLTGLNATQLRRDRILDEAVETVDPVHLMRLFGLSPATAMTYVRTAHPDRFINDPRRHNVASCWCTPLFAQAGTGRHI
ncbi:hypothetical protein [Saccharothrix sp. NRRL B-16348]|uniref:hypothetical protein n=1 Tax=Saccharothrix sp. NRRL B-16348 TaxID=1415542 RepID=UPI000B046B3E|nr:hypothetical protein [Saccharothrix sp. NRRL B-16348]